MALVRFRSYEPEDHPATLEISKYIWDGNDYLPHLINDFYNSDICHPMVGVKDNQIVAVANIRELNADIMWLEAMRTHPDYRGQGIVTSFMKYQISKSREMGKEEVWLFTSNENHATRKILKKLN